MWMARKIKASRSKKQRLLADYKKALAERRRLVNYLKSSSGILSKAEQSLLVEFAQLAKKKCERLRRAIEHNSNQHAA